MSPSNASNEGEQPRAAAESGGSLRWAAMNAGYLFVGVVLLLSVLWVGGYIKLGGAASLYRRIRLAALLWAAALTAIALTRIFGLP